MSEKKYELAVVGGGPGGYVAAIKAGQMGKDVLLIEKEAIGGTCLNWGCIPTKAFVRSAEVFADIKDASSFGINVDGAEVDFPKVVARKDKIVSRLVKGVEHLLKANNVDTAEGEASFVDKNHLSVKNSDGEKIIEAENIIIATGSQASNLPIPGADLDGILDSRTALSMEELPDSLIVVGGGIIGMEFAFIFNNFGVDVTVLEYLDQLVTGVDTEIAEELNKSARRRRITVKTGAEVEEIKKSDGEYEVIFSQKDKKKMVSGERVLMAVGRKPYHKGLNLDKVGVETEERRGGIIVDDYLRTNIDNIYAIGDVTDKILLAHVASHQGIIAVENIFAEKHKMNYDAVPGAIFTSPEVATVGLSEEEAAEKGIDYKVGRFPFAASGKVMAMGEREGKVKIIAEKNTEKVIGAAIIGIEATDLIAELTLAVNSGLKIEALAETIHAHPTTAEVIHEAALDMLGGAIHYKAR
ncbi:dihydrolipoamide dehydrogenase [Halanaerobium sp. DL-01]|jgi:dihydrolipoamide dehydrogenase|uniref:dihydrolipoyl dehydrogenase n=1 Tax=Halanaerobium sp. DL-01 TaxID=1653064 RepID=UPI000DF32C22|nr:dihydrolipoyl dehydrogenase [Halanaerobium sp. DL-01]RCW88509.1 dihydrolipoamide dehydrogenase [Halanaerobium sp. DL-01]